MYKFFTQNGEVHWTKAVKLDSQTAYDLGKIIFEDEAKRRAVDGCLVCYK
jgi:hypothetical protein